MKNLTYAALLAAVAFTWLFRYDLEPTGDLGFMFRLDRWTGQVHFIRGGTMERVTEKKPDWWLSDPVVPSEAEQEK